MFIADFHIHSKYSRATSGQCVPEALDLWARRKGLGLLGTGDFTHRAWREELREKLAPAEEGLYTLRDALRLPEPGLQGTPRFIVSGEISSIYKKAGRVRKVHNVLLLPSLEAAEALSLRLERIGNLHSDGRPILGLSSRDLLETALEVCPEVIFIPAHIWTPHFSLFGAYSGYDRIADCFEDLTCHIHALETGLSSDPPMNWRLSALDGYTLVSNSDAHSPGKLAREANLLGCALSYPDVALALRSPKGGAFLGTLEFFPEEGKYHYDGHRACQTSRKPDLSQPDACPVCGRPLTLGVLHRVEALADRAEGFVPPNAARFESLVPLPEVIAASTGHSPVSARGRALYEALLRHVGPELFVLRQAPLEDVRRQAGPLVAEGLRRLRAGDVRIAPGYDGVYGKVSIMDKAQRERFAGQTALFSPEAKTARAGKAASRRAEKNPAASGREAEGESAADSAPDSLNPQQREAAASGSAALAVIAGPGTGKTRTLVARVVHLVRGLGAPPGSVAAVTFTNKAAAQMRARLEGELGGKRAARGLTIGTFHSVCLRLLSAGEGAPGVLLDEAGALAVAEEALAALGLRLPCRAVLRAVSLHKNGGPLPAELREVFARYQALLAGYGAMDYDDLLLRALALAEEEASPGFAHLLVDEFQDINPLQYRLVKAWSRGCESLFVIGDPDQSIYGFRGSDPRCFDWFFRDFSADRVRLSQNYRSTPQILRAAASVLSREPLAAARPSGAKVRLLTAPDPGAEALFVARTINEMMGGLDMLDSGQADAPTGSRGFSDFAVLYRVNRQAEAFEQRFRKEGIPYAVTGRDDSLADSAVQTALAFFRFLVRPGDRLSLWLCLRDLAACPPGPARRVLSRYAEGEPGVPALAGILAESLPGEGAERFLALLAQYAPLALREKPAPLLAAWARDRNLAGHAPLALLASLAASAQSLPAFLDALALGQEGDFTRGGKKRPPREAVTLSTLHGAKGLEFSVVFLAGAADGLVPFRARDGSCGLEEERRLFYVGVTRAREELLLLAPGEPSPFLQALPRDILAQGDVQTPKRSPGYAQGSLLELL